MPLMIDAKIKPSGDFPAVDAADVLMPDGKRLTEAEFGSSVELDTSLSKSGQAADAAAVGQAVRELSDSLENLFEKKDIIPMQTLEVEVASTYPDYGSIWKSQSITCPDFVAGETYYVALNDEEYVCVAKEFVVGPRKTTYIGNLYAYTPEGTDSGEPFAILNAEASSSAYFYTNVEGVSTGYTGVYTHDVRVYQKDLALDLSGKMVGEVTLETYISNAVNSYIEEALGGDY